MAIAHITQTGNVSIPKQWRDELGIEQNSDVLIEKKDDKIIIQPLKKKMTKPFAEIDKEVKQKKIVFTRKEAVQDDLYD